MKLKTLSLKNFGPFRQYEIDLSNHIDNSCLLITGRNNEGKSNLIFALKLVFAGLKVIGKKRQEIYHNSQTYYKLYNQDTDKLLIERLVYNYHENIAEIRAAIDINFNIIVFIDPVEKMIYCDYDGVIPKNIENIFGFIPYLGMIAPREELIQNTSHLRASLNTSLAPHHLRNHIEQFIDTHQYKMIQDIVNNTWDSIELLDHRVDYFDKNRIDCFYKENKYDREIAWAGQGLQVWFQIITHLVRLLDTEILVLDEPEINLHPEKQNDLIAIIRQYYNGSIIIATHSMELMNNVNVDHIINVKKTQTKPKIKSTEDRNYLEIVRSQIGSNFNFISSQFENVDYIFITEDTYDFKIIKNLATIYGYNPTIFNVPIHGFSEYKKAYYYKEAYKLLIGHSVNYRLILDRDYYPDEYLTQIRDELWEQGISVIFTPGKEIENLLVNPNIIEQLFSTENRKGFREFFENLFTQEERDDSYGSFIKLHEEFLPNRTDTKTIITNYSKIFNQRWNDSTNKHNYIAGKKVLKSIRQFYKDVEGETLSNQMIYDILHESKEITVKNFLNDIFTKIKPATNTQ